MFGFGVEAAAAAAEPLRQMYIFRFRICFAAFGNLCVRAEERFSRLSRSNENTRAFIDSALTLDFSVTVMKCLQTGNTEQRFFPHSAICEGTDERIPIFLFFYRKE